MQPRKLNLFIGIPSYGGNGGISSEHPDIREWFTETILWAKSDPRIGEIHTRTEADTPITYVRNMFVLMARRLNCDVLVMCDSDQAPNLHKHELDFKPFVPSSFDFLYRHYDRGPVVIGAPYCGPPPGENVYVFRWDSDGVYGDETKFSLEQYTRHEAAQMRGIQPCAALPTGLIMYDLRAFELIEPCRLSKREVLERVATGQLTPERAERMLSEGFFYYEWEDGYAAKKASTEDVTNTRNISLSGMGALGYNPVYCNWDSPIGHWKPWCVPGRPRKFGVENVAASFKNAIEQDFSVRERRIWADFKDSDLGIKPEQYAHLTAAPVNRIAEHLPAANGKANGHANGQPRPPHRTPAEHVEALRSLVESEWVQSNGSDMVRFESRRLEVCEVGTWHGDTAKALVATGRCTVMCVDHWQGSDGLEELAKSESPLHKFLGNCRAEIDRGLINYRTGQSVEVARDFAEAGRMFDLVLLDADHSYEATKADIEAWLPLVREGGLLVLHDFCTVQFPGVRQAVEECLGSAAKHYGWSQEHGGFAVYRKERTHERVC